MMTENERLIGLIRQRKSKQTQWRYGITTADTYVRTLQECIGSDKSYRLMSRGNVGVDDLLRKASNTLVYSNPDMDFGEEEFSALDGSVPGMELPKNTLMAFKHVLTSSRKDRDGDVLHSDGASIDPKMLLLWQHVHTMPIGKAVRVIEQTPNRLVMVSAIVDMNELCHDSAVMVDSGMGRFSHGFQASEFKEIKAADGKASGFDVKKFEILEESLVSVPANPDAETQEVILDLVEGGKLKSSMLREIGRNIRKNRTLQIPGIEIKYREKRGEEEKEIVCNSFGDLKAAADMGLIGGESNANRPGDGSKTSGGGTEKEPTGTSEKADGKQEDGDEEEESGDKKMSCTECDYKGPPNDDGECPKCGAPMKEAKDDEEGKEEEEKSKSGWLRSMKLEMVGDQTLPYGTSIQNSFENISTSLRSVVEPFLVASGIPIGEKDWVWIVGTLPEKVVVCVERRGVAKKEYYQIPWKMDKNVPTLVGDPKSVEIISTTEILEKSMEPMEKFFYPPFGKPYLGEHAARLNDPDKYDKIRRQNDKFGEGIDAIWGVDKEGKTEIQAIRFDSSKFTAEEAKKWLEDHDMKPTEFEEAKKEEKKITQPSGEKTGRTLSRANESKIKKAKDHVDDVAGWDQLPRSHGAQLREASSHLGEVLTSVATIESPGSGPQSVTLQTAMSHFIAHADSVQRLKMIECLQAMEKVEKEDGLVEEMNGLLNQ